jgi:hypothetical protein
MRQACLKSMEEKKDRYSRSERGFVFGLRNVQERDPPQAVSNPGGATSTNPLRHRRKGFFLFHASGLPEKHGRKKGPVLAKRERVCIWAAECSGTRSAAGGEQSWWSYKHKPFSPQADGVFF